MGETSTTPASMMWDFLRGVFSVFDLVAYGLLYYVYQIFFNVTSADLFSNETVMKFYGRVQLIIGVFMMFQLAMTVLKGIMDPDSFTNAKTGAGNVIMRIATALVLLTVLVPINIPSPRNEYEIQLNNNGLLFGTLYSLQHRILSNNTLGRLILGTNDSSSYSASSDDLKTASRIFTSTILKGFYRINLKPENERPKHEDGKDDSVFNDNRMCTDIDDDVLDAYTRIDANYSDIIGMYKYTCEVDDDNLSLMEKAIALVSPKYAGKERYVFTMMPFISAVVGFIFVFILVSFSIDVAIRAVKLVILRLIAPIPIIMYMDPKGTKDSAFSTWVKTLTSTYLDLFIRLATVYFVIFLVQDMMINGVVMDVGGSGVVSLFTHIIIWIGLFVFAKQAPKFIRQVLGIKDEGGKLFGGLGQALALGSVAGGIVGGAISRGAASYQKNSANPEHSTAGNVGRSLLAGIAGGFGGGINAGRAFYGNDKADRQSIANANRAYNARNYSNSADDSTFWGRTTAGLQGAFGFKNQQQRFDDQAKAYDGAAAAMKRVSNILDNDGRLFGSVNDFISGFNAADFRDGGEQLIDSSKQYSIKDLKDLNDRVQASSKYSVQTKERISKAYKDAQGIRVKGIVSQQRDSITNADDLSIFDSLKTISAVAHRYGTAGGTEFIDPNTGNLMDAATHDFSATEWGKFKQAAGAAERQSAQIKGSAQYARAKANAQRAEQNAKK